MGTSAMSTVQQHDQLRIQHLIANAVVTDPDAILTCGTLELHTAWWAGVILQTGDSSDESVVDPTREVQ
jgi:hypothetical protein